jgi:opacity protein-like surface antigen
MFARRVWSSLLAATSITAACFSATAIADAADGEWNGRYHIVTFASDKMGTSVAAAQREPDFSASYVLSSDCSSGLCVATVVEGPTPSNPTIPQPVRYIWDGSRWQYTYNWQWQCFRGAGVPSEYAPTRSKVFYAPDIDGSMFGIWHTDILAGPCRGSVIMPVAAYPA